MAKNNFVHLSSCARAFLNPQFGKRKGFEFIIQLSKQREATLSISDKKPSGQWRTKGQEHIQILTFTRVRKCCVSATPLNTQTQSQTFPFAVFWPLRELPAFAHFLHTRPWQLAKHTTTKDPSDQQSRELSGLHLSAVEHKSSLSLCISLLERPPTMTNMYQNPPLVSRLFEWSNPIR